MLTNEYQIQSSSADHWLALPFFFASQWLLSADDWISFIWSCWQDKREDWFTRSQELSFPFLMCALMSAWCWRTHEREMKTALDPVWSSLLLSFNNLIALAASLPTADSYSSSKSCGPLRSCVWIRLKERWASGPHHILLSLTLNLFLLCGSAIAFCL